MAKFCGNYGTLIALNESGTSSEDTLQKVLELFKSKHPKQNGTFVFIDCWLIFKDMPRWLETREESKKVMLMKSKMLMVVGTFDSLDEFLEIGIGIKHEDDYNEHKVLKRPQGSHVMKDKLKNHAMRDCALKTQTKAIVDMVAFTLKKTRIMENQSVGLKNKSLEKQVPNSKAREYLKL